MAIVRGETGGFVSSEPSGTPTGTGNTCDGYVYAFRDTSPAGTNAVSKVGYYQHINPVSAVGFQVGIYENDETQTPDKPGALVATAVDGTTKTTNGWNVANYAWNIASASTDYWIAFQHDADSSYNPQMLYTADAGAQGRYDSSKSALDDPWDTADSGGGLIFAVYALYAAAGGVPNNDPFIRPFAGPFGRAL